MCAEQKNSVQGWEDCDHDLWEMGRFDSLRDLRKQTQDGLWMVKDTAMAGPHIMAGLLDRIAALKEAARSCGHGPENFEEDCLLCELVAE